MRGTHGAHRVAVREAVAVADVVDAVAAADAVANVVPDLGGGKSPNLVPNNQIHQTPNRLTQIRKIHQTPN